MGLMVLIFTISILSLASIEKETQLDSLTSEIKISLAQVQGQTINGHLGGVYFETNRLVSFSGNQFVEGDPNNQETTLPPEIIFSTINLPANTISFAQITGYVKNFTSGENLTLLEQGTGKTRKITINKLGTVEVE